MTPGSCWDLAIGDATNQVPDFNDDLLLDYRKRQVDQFVPFFDTVFTETARMFNGLLEYKGSQPLEPVARVRSMLCGNGSNKQRNRQYFIQRNEMELREFKFVFHDRNRDEEISVPIHIPYLHRGALVINDTKYYMYLPIIDRVIYHDPSNDGVIIKVLRSPYRFWRSKQYTYTTTCGKRFTDVIITTQLHYGSKDNSNSARGSRGSRTTVPPVPLLVYLLANDNFTNVMESFGLTQDMIQFTDAPNPDDEYSYYFEVTNHPGICVRVDKSVMEETNLTHRRIVASLLYIINNSKRASLKDVYGTTFYKINLGYYTNTSTGDLKEPLAAAHAENHLNSLRTSLDDYTRKELRLVNIDCKDVFELLTIAFTCIDVWLIDYVPNDLFDKRIGGVDQILLSAVKDINSRLYDKIGHNDSRSDGNERIITSEDIKKILKFGTMLITSICYSDALRANTALYNDNTLTSVLIKKIRQSASSSNGRPFGKGKAKSSKHHGNITTDSSHFFHPSTLAIESILAISDSNPGNAGDINPYAVIDQHGQFRKDLMPWYDDIKDIEDYIVRA